MYDFAKNQLLGHVEQNSGTRLLGPALGHIMIAKYDIHDRGTECLENQAVDAYIQSLVNDREEMHSSYQLMNKPMF